MEQIKKTTIKALVIKDGKALFVKDNAGLWELPGGTMEAGEQEAETLRRELKEELNIEDVKIGALITSGSFVVEKPEWDKTYTFMAKIYEADFDTDDLELSDEHIEVGWFNKKQMRDLRTRDIYRESANLKIAGSVI